MLRRRQSRSEPPPVSRLYKYIGCVQFAKTKLVHTQLSIQLLHAKVSDEEFATHVMLPKGVFNEVVDCDFHFFFGAGKDQEGDP